jgi:hypothetical protein
MARLSAMGHRETLSLLEKRVREVERLASDCILEGDILRLQRSVSDYGKAASAPWKLRRARVMKLTQSPRAIGHVRSRARGSG